MRSRNDLRKLYEYQGHLREELLREHRKAIDGGDFYPTEELEYRESRPVPTLSYTLVRGKISLLHQ